MNYKLSTTLQWTLILISGAVALKMGKQYGRQQADDMVRYLLLIPLLMARLSHFFDSPLTPLTLYVEQNHEYSDATTKGDIAKAIASYNEDLDQQESSQVMASK